MESLEEVKKRYKLTPQKHDIIFQRILDIYLKGKYSVKNPQAIINIAPPGSGKTGLNGYSASQFPNNNVIIINSDEIKKFHPYNEEVAREYPQFYTQVTDQESNTWTSDLLEYCLNNKYNVIFEGTGKNTRILNTISEKMQGHIVTVRGMAVNELNCLISILERYEGQLNIQGFGRLVTLQHFYETYNNMPDTIEEIEKSGKVCTVEVYARGESPSNPKLIYSSKEKISRFHSAKFAVLGGRIEDFSLATSKINEFIEGFQDLLGITRMNLVEFEKNLKNLEECGKISMAELELLLRIFGIQKEINGETER